MSTIAVNQITNTSGLSAPVFPPGSAQLNPMASREDKIINGDFSIWQRGTNSGVINGYGAADRWRNNYLSGAVGHVRLDHPNGRLFGSNVPSVYLRQNIAGQTGTNAFAATVQRIEGVRSYAGQTITILGWARRTTGAGNMVVEMEQFFGTGTNSPSNRVVGISPTTVTLNAPWAPFAVVVNVPNILETNVLGNEQNDYLALNFWASAGTDYDARTNNLGLQTLTMDLWGIHIRHGTWTAAATADYRQRDPGTELTLCRRYYRISPPLQGAMRGGNDNFVAASFGNDMRRPTPLYSTRFTAGAIHHPAVAFYNIASVVSLTPDYFTVVPSTLFGGNVPAGFIAGVFAAESEL